MDVYYRSSTLMTKNLPNTTTISLYMHSGRQTKLIRYKTARNICQMHINYNLIIILEIFENNIIKPVSVYL